MKLENKLLEEFKRELVKLCKKYNAKIEANGDYGMNIEFIIADDGYSKVYEDLIYSITPDGVESENP